VTCAVSGAIVIGGEPVSTKPPDVKKGDDVSLGFVNRNGTQAIASKIG
jgi:hypothetical protein